ncbi:Sec63-domain-containing protein [Coniophora puteana RWD-64-598 SS2]|uniref:RNA helicase n=1 Tax=Coniophora puteana (strain RWD-64-598) TaxID=741705 RepID=R7SF05_CONPW|nr:Sec63-domain-containing protein [Coniophora puteana RWD-64-598 SS2]EIW74460.1 Sec63-domain-containing protein [Coniophora puteana RWD-64-598 SS2]
MSGGGRPAGKPDLSGYNYGAISSLVLTADRSALPRRDKEPDGAPTSLAGRIDPREMGSRVQRAAPKDLDKKKKKAAAERSDAQQAERRKRPEPGAGGFGYTDIIEATQDVEGLTYRPRTAETREVYEMMLSVVHQALGDQAQDVVRSATDTVLESLKNENMKDFDKKREVEDVLGSLPNDTFSQLVALSKKVTDYADEDERMADPDMERKDAEIDDEVGVAVVFDEEEQEEEEDEGFEVREESDDEDEEAAEGQEEEGAPEDEENDEELVIGADSSRGVKTKADKDIVSPHAIDGFWVQRQISEIYPDPVTAADKAQAVLTILGSESSLRDCENELMELFEYQSFDVITRFLKNRDVIVWCTKLMRSDADERVNVEVAMREKGVGWILRELAGNRGGKKTSTGAAGDAMDVDTADAAAAKPVPKTATLAPGSTVTPKRTVDLESMAFSQGGHLMSNKKCKLPDGSFKRSRKGFEEIHVPAPKKKDGGDDERVPVTELPEWVRPAFTIPTFNRMQSKLFPVAFGSDEPLLLCAPTGAGKTNVAMLTILNELAKHRNDDGSFALDEFKCVYVAPMKALVQEMVGNFSQRLGIFGMKVGELTGDSQMTKQQIAETQVIVTTPEKWDVITRKSTDTSYTNIVRLIIIDEIHLLHDERGPVLESLVARTVRRMEQTGDYVRLVGLSATLPNYQDVAAFLRVDPAKGLFYFDASFRPCPLQQQFIGVTEKKAIKRYQVMNEVCYEKVLDQAGKNQTLVFVHSRKETAKTARFIRDMAMEKETITQFVRADSATREILTEEASNVKDPNLRDLLPFGFAIHHAGMSREDRGLVEELFADGAVQVLVCTATLAWGVNLPAHTVIIKGTQIYNPEKGRWVELSSQDVLQMLGRAGRPQYDTFGEGIIITNHGELQYYLSLMNQQLPIESQFVSKLADNLNAEVVLGTVRNRDEAVQWLGYTYLYVRMLREPGLYSVGVDYQEDDPGLIQKRADIIHTAAALLEKCHLLKYERSTGRFQSTELGRIASHYYVVHSSMQTYNQHLRPSMSTLDLFRVFALSNEFKLLPVRQEEKLELGKLLERVPIPVKESVDEPAAKINVLLQAYISQLKLEGFALVADMVYVTQSAGRILRAMFEICLKRGWAVPARACLDLCKMVEKRMWGSMTPLRQFKGVPADVVRKAEGKQFPWYRYFDLTPPEIGELIGLPNAGRLVHRLVHSFPKLQLQAQVQPITRSLLRIDLSITPDFRWDEKIHGGAETFQIMVEDVDGEIVLFHDSFILLQRYAEDEHNVTITVPMFEPAPPNYYISVVSDRWLHAETRLPISFQYLILPEKFPPPTPLLELQPLPLSALHNKEFETIYGGSGPSSIETFNKIQTQVFQALYTSDENVFIGAPTGSGKTICAEFALLRLWSKRGEEGQRRAVCIEPYQEMVDMRTQEWRRKFGSVQGGKEVVSLTGEASADLRLLEKGDVIVCTPAQWDVLSRRWRQRKNVQNIGLLIADEVQLVGGEVGPTYEVIISRTRYVSAQTDIKTRVVACGVSLANARDLGEWMGAPSHAIFNFSPSSRPLDMDIHLQSFSIPHFPSLMIAMSKPAYLAINEYAPTKPTIVFVPSRRQCRLTVDDLLTHCSADDDADRFLNIELADLQPHLDHVSDKGLAEVLAHGIGYYHEALDAQDKRIVERLFQSGAIQVLVASKDTAWSLPVACYMVIIMGVQYYEGKEHRYVDYPVMDVLQMMGRACRPREDDRSRCVLMTQQTRKEFYKKFLSEGLPIESHLSTHMLHDYFLAEIAVKTIENKQDAMDILTWTYFYRRMTQNPNYYNLHNVSHQHLSDHLSELVENTLQDLVNSKCISIEDEMDVSPLNLGMIAAYYNISYVTVEVYTLSLKERTKLKGLLEVVSSSAEFETIPIRRHEDVLLRRIYDRVPVKLDRADFEAPHFKTFLLLQAHFSRLQLPPDLAADQALVLEKVLNLLSACVDVMSSNAWLNALGAMDLSQMCVQAMWETDSPLKQIPHFEPDVVKRCRDAGVESVYDIMEMEDDDRTKLLQMDSRQMRDVATFVNSYPTLDVSFELAKGEYTAGAPIIMQVALSRDADEDDPDDSAQTVVAPFYPGKKMANWWLVVGEPSTKQLLVIKRVTVNKSLAVKLEFTLPKGSHDLKLYVICDSYVGADHDLKVDTIDVAEGEDSDSDEDMESGSEMEE